MHTKRAARWVSSVAVLSASALGLGAPFAAPASAAGETISASASQNLQTANNPLYAYATGNTATINATVNGATGTTNVKGVVNTGPDAGVHLTCTQAGAVSNWTCQYANGGTPGADAITIWDDNSPAGTVGQPDPDEAQTTLTVNFEKLTASVSPPRTQSGPSAQANVAVAVAGKPAGWTPRIQEVLQSGAHSSLGGCTDTSAGAGTSFNCTVINDGRVDAATVEVFDDFTKNNAPDANEPSATANVYFEQVSASLDQTGNHSAGSTVTFSATASGVPDGQSANFDYEVTCGPDGPTYTVPPSTTRVALTCGSQPPAGATTPTAPVVHTCSNAVPASCSLTNNGTPGTDGVTVFDDTNNNGAFDAGEPSTTLAVVFGDSMTATPRASAFPTKDSNNPGSGQAPIDVSLTSGSTQAPDVFYTVIAGNDKDTPTGTSHQCQGSGGSWVCTVPNTSAQAGQDTVEVFNDPSGNGTVPTNPPAGTSAQTHVSFVMPTSVALTPTLAPGQSQAQIAKGGCQIYTVTVSPNVQFPVQVLVAQGLGTASSAPPASLSTCAVPGGSAVSANNAVTSSGGFPPLSNPTWTDSMSITGYTNQDPAHPGQMIFGLSSNTPGTVSINAQTNLANSPNKNAGNNQSLNVVTPGPAHSLSAKPASSTIAAGGNVAFTVLVQDASATPIPGAAVSYVVSAGDPDATTKAVSCTAADQFGQAHCSLANNRNVGVDHVTFFAPQTSGETAPASGDPQTTATVTVTALPPAGSTLTFGCPDELVTDANHIVPNCTVSTLNGSQRQVIFAAHVADAGGSPLANLPVSFTLVSAPSGSTASANQVNTNAKGNALYIVTVPSPAAGGKITAKAQVGDPSNGGLGPDTASATFQAPHPFAVGISPKTQQIGAGGTATLTGRVIDQFGVGVAGQTLDWAVSGRNSRSGQLVTGSNGTGSFSYNDTGSSGSDSVNVLDVSSNAPSGAGSNNPASASVTFTSSGCTSNCGGGGTAQKERPTLTVSQSPASGHQAKLKLVVTSHPKLVNASVVFYTVSKSGTRHKIGVGRTGTGGRVTGTLKAASGQHLRFQAKVVGKAGVSSGYSNVVKVHVI